MFYNCTSLISIPDINDWNISKDIDIYLMFYNCISLIYFRNSAMEKIPEAYYINSGILITKYYQKEK
jgi:surface protein